MQSKLSGLYGISDVGLTPYTHLFDYLEAAIDGGLRIFQLRDKQSHDKDLRNLAVELQAFCKEKNIVFIINDRFHLALDLGLDGVHLGRDELEDFDSFRAEFKGIIGVSCYGFLDRARFYEAKGADYLAFGAFFPSRTKPGASICDLEILERAASTCKKPICAIGGITSSNANLLARANMLAVISSLWPSPHLGLEERLRIIKSNAEAINLAFDSKASSPGGAL